MKVNVLRSVRHQGQRSATHVIARADVTPPGWRVRLGRAVALLKGDSPEQHQQKEKKYTCHCLPQKDVDHPNGTTCLQQVAKYLLAVSDNNLRGCSGWRAKRGESGRVEGGRERHGDREGQSEVGRERERGGGGR